MNKSYWLGMKELGRRILMCLLLLALAGGCRRTSPQDPELEFSGAPYFQDVTAESGLDFVHEVGSVALDQYFMPHIMGSGVAIFDFDNDGRPDIYLVQNGGPKSRATNRLFHQGADGRFSDVSKGSGLDIVGHGMGVAIGDVNNDGFLDVVVTEYRGIRLFLNTGKGTFFEVTQEAGLDSPLWATSASFVDYDRDGWLDLVVTNYLDYDPTRICSVGGETQRDFCAPKYFGGTVTRLYHNLGNAHDGTAQKVRFEDVTLKSGIGQLPGPGLGVVCADFNGDHWPDIFIANDLQPNRLWINQHDGTFKDEAALRGIAYNGLGQLSGNMGIGLADVKGDGLFDIFVTHLAEETHTLWHQSPVGFFSDQTGNVGLAQTHWRGTGFGVVVEDFDHKGAPDIAVVNGRVYRRTTARPAAEEAFWDPYLERNQIFANDGAGHFQDFSLRNEPFCGPKSVSRGLACGDLDGDGALDLVSTSVAGPARIFRNVAPKRGNWLHVRALDPALGGRDAYGAEITVHAGQKSWKRWLNPGSSYLSSNNPRAHFGLGSVAELDRIQVIWPDGKIETFGKQAVNRAIVLRKGSGQ